MTTTTGRPGREYPRFDDGFLPDDRTICPHCLGLEGEVEFCKVCKGQPVCPTCRNGRVLSIAASRQPAYRLCPDCCDELQDANGQPMRTETGVPMWLWRRDRQQDTIRAYRAARWRERRDPWDEVQP